MGGLLLKTFTDYDEEEVDTSTLSEWGVCYVVPIVTELTGEVDTSTLSEWGVCY